MWQVVSAIALVVGVSVGGFILSLNTPTVGLGCRTGGYLIYVVIALALHLAELLVWWFTSPLRDEDEFRAHIRKHTQHAPDQVAGETKVIGLPGLLTSNAVLRKFSQKLTEILVCSILFLIRLLPLKHKRSIIENTEYSIRQYCSALQDLTTRDWLERIFFTPVEFTNTVWLSYMIMAQTAGAFNNCACMTSTWGGWGGYMDFTQSDHADSPLVAKYWLQGTIITCVFMGVGMGYIVLEWLLQAHLSTENYRDAANGLQRVRRFRRGTHWILYPSTLMVTVMNNFLSACRLRSNGERKILVWSKESNYRPRVGAGIIGLSTNA
ncbi:hypothetical protein BU24DRAFT_395962 [Aaosphaeria arxii CBS 175.79]|uniref:Uncharacterized protein n=1 Tax=Aaosphaeria arxii CBS 175.79 TaxID=1450172 RepID=A0A6A5XHP8_9PLEO|nr:uncharacterized protein BU24DRAFT_395962 [Aaosphaeria arxii CBS 175.79]KAF2012795.1 hypothetical protein BU24DRAFT_395962 [Aaosphaeria arxii CBS 175.79]